MKIRLVKEKETRGTVRYVEIANGSVVIGHVHIRKDAFKDSKYPQRLTLSLEFGD